MDYKLISSTSGDWEGLYVNDKLEMQCHSIQLGESYNFKLKPECIRHLLLSMKKLVIGARIWESFQLILMIVGETRKYETCN